MKLTDQGISRRGLFGATAGLAAIAGAGIPDLVLAEATAPAATDTPPPASVGAAEAAVAQHSDTILRISREVWDLSLIHI